MIFQLINQLVEVQRYEGELIISAFYSTFLFFILHVNITCEYYIYFCIVTVCVRILS